MGRIPKLEKLPVELQEKVIRLIVKGKELGKGTRVIAVKVNAFLKRNKVPISFTHTTINEIIKSLEAESKLATVKAELKAEKEVRTIEDFEVVKRAKQLMREHLYQRYIGFVKRMWEYAKQNNLPSDLDISWRGAEGAALVMHNIIEKAFPQSMWFHALVAWRNILKKGGRAEELGYYPTDEYKKFMKARDILLPANLYDKAIKGLSEFEKLIVDLHITLGCREGYELNVYTKRHGGLYGLRWENFKENFRFVDVFETKTKGGKWWKNCPVDLFFPDLPERIMKYHVQEGRPQTGPFIAHKFPKVEDFRKFLVKIWNKMSFNLSGLSAEEWRKKRLEIKALKSKYAKTRDFELLQKIDELEAQLRLMRPHDARRTHATWLAEMEVPFQYIAGIRDLGICGVGWEDYTVLAKHYAVLSPAAMTKVHAFVRENFNKYQRGEAVRYGA